MSDQLAVWVFSLKVTTHLGRYIDFERKPGPALGLDVEQRAVNHDPGQHYQKRIKKNLERLHKGSSCNIHKGKFRLPLLHGPMKQVWFG